MKLSIPTSYEPKQKNRFIIKFPKEYEIEEYTVKSATNITFSYNEKGQIVWDDIVFTFYSFITPSIEQRLMKVFMTDGVIEIPEIQIELVDPTGLVVSLWTIKNSRVKRVDFDEFNYAKEGLRNVTLTVSPHICVLAY